MKFGKIGLLQKYYSVKVEISLNEVQSPYSIQYKCLNDFIERGIFI